ncbi:MAG: anaerobic ribonucleoside-triphosphate reductase activating protein [Candidatus Aenigmatarchaeota archaeon]|nr:MAG: anaerobic ribonucleoside-triphosphate reductase activating protein [Candidatus Aenigmarchaeota archaeon]
MIEIKGWHKFSMIDYPGRSCSVIFLPGCNFRCPFCQNPDLLKNPEGLPTLDTNEIIRYIQTEKMWIDAVCITGGEPTIHKDLPEFLKRFKDAGILVKLDTNGSNPEMIKNLLESGLVDYIAMDIKAPLRRYPEAVGVDVDIGKIMRSVELIRNSGIDYEFRTTVLPRLHKKDDIVQIGKELRGSRRYVIQQFRPGKTLDERYANEKTYSERELQELADAVRGFFDEVEIRR